MSKAIDTLLDIHSTMRRLEAKQLAEPDPRVRADIAQTLDMLESSLDLVVESLSRELAPRGIELSQGQVVTIDNADYAEVSKHVWCAAKKPTGNFYAVTRIDGEQVPLHRFLMKPGPGEVVDHINGNGLDNRRGNLRLCSNVENIRNAHKHRRAKGSIYKGVYRIPGAKERPWRATCAGVNVGHFQTEEEAARAYDQAALSRFGEFARTNFQQKEPA